MATPRIRGGEIMLPTGRHPYQLRRSRRARRLLLKVMWPDQIEVVLPYWASYRKAEQFLHGHQQWLIKILTKHQLLRTQLPQRAFVSGAILPLLGQSVQLQIKNAPSSPARYYYHLPVLRIVVPPAHSVRAVVERWYRAQARQYFIEQTAVFAAELSVVPRVVRIGNQKTQWGSCGMAGRLSFNWRLLLAPAAVARYVAAHEVAHLKYRNHSQEFWQLLVRLDPRCREQQQWLKKHGHTLVL